MVLNECSWYWGACKNRVMVCGATQVGKEGKPQQTDP